jgi:hypothetical protein
MQSHTRTTVFIVLGALVTWAAAHWLWPWCGPYLLEPCPVATALGQKVALVVGAMWGLARGLALEVADHE